MSGVLRTHVTGGEGLEPTQWDSDTATIACFTEGPPPPPPPPVDATPPDTTISSGPAALSNVASAAFTFDSEPGAAFECRLDSAAFEPCATPAIVTALADGDHTFAARAIDAAGNVDPSEATWAFTVDTTPPETTISSGPAAVTNDAAPIFALWL